jgi:hypothetical protein
MRKAIAAVILLIAAGAAALGIASSAAASTSTEHFSLISVTINQSDASPQAEPPS